MATKLEKTDLRRVRSERSSKRLLEDATITSVKRVGPDEMITIAYARMTSHAQP